MRCQKNCRIHCWLLQRKMGESQKDSSNLGLGWEEAHHPWSKNKHQYSAFELLKHLCEVVIPLQDVKEVPNQAPIKLPARPDSFML
jgi:hypothetical protein